MAAMGRGDWSAVIDQQTKEALAANADATGSVASADDGGAAPAPGPSAAPAAAGAAAPSSQPQQQPIVSPFVAGAGAAAAAASLASSASAASLASADFPRTELTVVAVEKALDEVSHTEGRGRGRRGWSCGSDTTCARSSCCRLIASDCSLAVERRWMRRVIEGGHGLVRVVVARSNEAV